MGIIAYRVGEAFAHYKKGHLKAFVRELVDIADNSVHSQTHRNVLDREIERHFKNMGAETDEIAKAKRG